MKKSFALLILLTLTDVARAQNTFKAGWNTYNTATLIHEYTYNLTITDSIRLALTDSLQIFVTADSLVTQTIHAPQRDKSVSKTVNYLSAKKQIVKTEEYKDDNLTMSKEWRFDDKNIISYYYEDNRVNGNSFRKTYDHVLDKKTGEMVLTESSYNNGRIEFYTKSYFDKKNQKYKEVRYNDNNKDVVHIESFFYGDNGKLKERSVYFPEWKVTKKFEEKEGNMLPKCSKISPVGIADKVMLATRIPYIKKVVAKNQPLISDPECQYFEFTFRNWTNCDIIVSNGPNANVKKVVFRFKEKLL